jgi:hypothetical protein
MRQDQVQHLFQKIEIPGLSAQIARVMGYNHFEWISKDVDAYFSHVPQRHKVTYEIPESALQTGIDPQAIADVIKGTKYYEQYAATVPEGEVGRMLLHDYQIFPSEVSDSGWKVTFSYSFIIFDTPYW